MFSVKIVARPDARMVEVPLELESELPREFEGQAVLASSGVPRKVKLRAAKDALKLSTAYRADVLLADIVRLSLRGTVGDMAKVQEAAQRFVRLVRERRQDGATLTVSSNGRGKIEVSESGISAPAVPQQRVQVASTGRPTGMAAEAPQLLPVAQAAQVLSERFSALERRISQLESALPQLSEGRDLAAGLDDQLRKVQEAQAALEQRLEAMHAELRAAEAEHATRSDLLQQQLGSLGDSGAAGESARELATPLQPQHGRGASLRATAVDAFAEGLRGELRGRVQAAKVAARPQLERIERAAALAAEGALNAQVPMSAHDALHELSAQAAARYHALERIGDEVEFYAAPELPLAALLIERLERQAVGDPVEPLRRAVAGAAPAGSSVPDNALASWVARAASACGDALWEARAGEHVDPAAHEVSAACEPRGAVVRTVAPGVRRTDGQLVRKPRVETSVKAAAAGTQPAPAAATATGAAGSEPAVGAQEASAAGTSQAAEHAPEPHQAPRTAGHGAATAAAEPGHASPQAPAQPTDAPAARPAGEPPAGSPDEPPQT